MRKILVLLTACIFTVSFSESESAECKEINIWHKLSTDAYRIGEIVSLDMSHGYSIADHKYIYIIAFELITGDTIVTVFPNGGHWESPKPDPFLQEMQKEFDSLEDYLKSQESKEIKKK